MSDVQFTYDLVPFGDRDFLIRIIGEALPQQKARICNTLATHIRKSGLYRDVIPTIDTIGCRLDTPLHDMDIAIKGAQEIVDQYCRDGKIFVSELIKPETDNITEFLELPVLYGGKHGPDLEDVARLNGVSQEDIIAHHTAHPFPILMIGFAPGFAYLGPVPDILQVRRKSVPRPLVPAGSVALAGQFTGVYPFASPGGWQIIGRTEKSLVLPGDVDPFVLKPGLQVRFRCVERGF